MQQDVCIDEKPILRMVNLSNMSSSKLLGKSFLKSMLDKFSTPKTQKIIINCHVVLEVPLKFILKMRHVY